MGLIAKTITTAAAIFGAATFSQAPEFAQQYRQRLGGALDELRVIVEDFDRDAQSFNLDRQNALTLFSSSDKEFIRARGLSMRKTLARYDNLNRQASEFNETAAVLRPFVMLAAPDTTIVGNAWRDFQPAVPVTPAGVIWAVIGALAAACATFLLSLIRVRPKRRSRPHEWGE